MPPGGKVIEVRRLKDDHNNCYFTLASGLKMSYYYLLAKPVDNDLHNGNCILDANQLAEFLQVHIN